MNEVETETEAEQKQHEDIFNNNIQEVQVHRSFLIMRTQKKSIHKENIPEVEVHIIFPAASV